MAENLNFLDHLPLLKKSQDHDRKKRKPHFMSPPKRGGRNKFAGQIDNSIQKISSYPIDSSISHPRLVFKVPVADGVPLETLAQRFNELSISVVSYESGNAIIAFKEDSNLSDFRDAIAKYKQGPSINSKTGEHYKTTKWDVFEYIEADKLDKIPPEDRLSPRLKELIGASFENVKVTEIYKIDLELWHNGSSQTIQESITEIQSFLKSAKQNNVKILDQYVGQNVCYLRVAIAGSLIKKLASIDVVADMELPPHVALEIVSHSDITADDLEIVQGETSDSLKVCILDSGISSGHKLIKDLIVHQEAFFTNDSDPNDQNGHGTAVAGIVAYGDIANCVNDKKFISNIRLISARVLNQNCNFDDEKLIINQMDGVVKKFSSAPYSCRIFNFSLGSGLPVITDDNRKQTAWAEALDELCRKYDVIMIVASGNNRDICTKNATEAENNLNTYKDRLLGKDNHIDDPATAAIPITVGSLANSSSVAPQASNSNNDICKPLAGFKQPSPFSRIGPGINGAIKPEFVDFGGNLAFQGFSNVREINENKGCSVLSLNWQHLQTMFSYHNGTSFSSPLVARKAALTLNNIKNQIEKEPSANLIRALLASAAEIPKETHELFKEEQGHNVVKVCGYGITDEHKASWSTDKSVVMFVEDELKVDSFSVYQIPIPEAFKNATGDKRLVVALAFDPPVRRRRLDYLGAEMSFEVIKGCTSEKVISAFKKVAPGADAESIKQSNKVSFYPGTQPRGNIYNRKKSTLQKGETIFKRMNNVTDDTYWLVIRSERKWAPADYEVQRFAAVVRLESSDDRLYEQVKQRVKVKVRTRARS